MISFSLGFIAGAVAAVVSPPLFRYVARKVSDFEAWRANRKP